MNSFRRRLLTGVALAALAPGAFAAAPTPPAEGAKAPLVAAASLNGKPFSPAAVKGKPLLLLFWATWCPTCRRELPELQTLHEMYHDDGLQILALSIDDTEQVVKDYLADKKFDFPVAMRSDPWFDLYGKIRGTPTAYLIGRDGKVRKKYVGGFTNELRQDLKLVL